MKLTAEERAQICQLYLDGEIMRTLALQFNVGYGTIRTILVNAGIPRRGKSRSKFLKASERALVIKLYEKERMSATQIGRLLGSSKNPVLDILKRAGKLRSKSEQKQKYQRNSHYFEKIDSSQKAYWLGLFAADGCIHKNVFIFNLESDDKNMLRDFLNDLESNAPITTTRDQRPHKFPSVMSRIDIGDIALCANIRALGFTERKTFTLRFPYSIEKKYYSHFIRGFVDGDGTIHGNQRHPTTQAYFNIPSASKKFIVAIQKILIKECHLNRNAIVKVGNVYKFQQSGNIACYRIYRYLYKDATRWLPRKREIFEEILRAKIAQLSLDL